MISDQYRYTHVTCMFAYVAAACIGRSRTFASDVKSAIRLLYRLNRPTERCLCLPFCILLLQLYITNTVTSRSMGEVGMI